MKNIQAKKEYIKSLQIVQDFILLTTFCTALIYFAVLHFYFNASLIYALKILINTPQKTVLAILFLSLTTSIFACLFFFQHFLQVKNNDEYQRGSRFEK